jgi:hypothetical protein
MRAENAGMRLSYDALDTPAPTAGVSSDAEVSLTVDVQPADASNVVELFYRINGGPSEKAVAAPVRHVGDTQYFRVRFPPAKFHAGDLVEYGAVCYCAGRQVPSPDEEKRFASSFRVVGVKPEAKGPAAPTGISVTGPIATTAGSDAAFRKFALQIDARSLLYRSFSIPGVTPNKVGSREVHTLQFSPGLYAFQVTSALPAGFIFRLTPEGTVDYDASCDGFLEGRGTRTLTILGLEMALESESRQQREGTVSEALDLISPPCLVIDGTEWGLDRDITQRYNDVAHLLYVGNKSTDLIRQNLVVFKVGTDGTTLSEPTMFPDHPDPLLAQNGQNSWVKCIASDPRWPQKLFLGLEVDQATGYPYFQTPLVVYDLDTNGMPVVRPPAPGVLPSPLAFKVSAVEPLIPYAYCYSIAFRPRDPLDPLDSSNAWLYAVGYGFPWVAAWRLDSFTGIPQGSLVTSASSGSVGYASVGVTPDRSMLCLSNFQLGRQVPKLEIRGFNLDGSPGGVLSSYDLEWGDPQSFVPLTVGSRGVYYVSTKGLLAYFGFDSDGKPTGAGETPFKIRSLAHELKDGNLVVAVDHYFTDAITDEQILDGCVLQEISLDPLDGVPRAFLTPSGVTVRERCLSYLENSQLGVSSMPAPVIAATPITGFLGNRIAGLGLRVSVPALTATGVLALDATSLKLTRPESSDYPQYLRFAYSATAETVYAAGESGTSDTRELTTVSLDTWSIISRVSCPDATDVICVDAIHGIVYVALDDGRVAVFSLDPNGVPSAPPSTMNSGLSLISCFCLHPQTGKLYAFGLQGGPTADLGIVPMAGSSFWKEAVIVPTLGPPDFGGICYACSWYNGTDPADHPGHKNLWVWQLGSNGVPAGDPKTFTDGLPNGTKRGKISGVRVDATKPMAMLYLGGNNEDTNTGQVESDPAVITYQLDLTSGMPIDNPNVYPSSSTSGYVSAIELAAGRLYESGYGHPTIFAWELNSNGDPTGVKQASSYGTMGEEQLQVTADGTAILGGALPWTLDRAPILPSGDLRAGTRATFTIPHTWDCRNPKDPSDCTQAAELGILGPGLGDSEQMDLDRFLKGKTGTAFGTVTLSTPGSIVGATVHCDVTRKIAMPPFEIPVQSVDAIVDGNQAALLLPFYGIDDESQLAARIEGSAKHYQQYQLWAEGVGSGSPITPQTIVANGLIGIDAGPVSLKEGLKTLQLLGHNTIEAWGFDGMPADEVVAAAGLANFQRFGYSTYRPGFEPGAIFAYEPPLAPVRLGSWATWLKTQTIKPLPPVDRLVLFHMADEPAWYYPDVSKQIGDPNDPTYNSSYIKAFQAYLQGTGLLPSDFGVASFADLMSTGTLSQATAIGATVTSKRLLYWTARFFAESASDGFRNATQTLKELLNTQMLITANCGIHRYFTPSPNKVLDDGRNLGPDGAVGAPDLFDLGRKKAISCLWTEDWFVDQSAQLWSFYGDLLRCAATNGGIAFGGHVVGQTLAAQPQAIPDGATYKIMALVGRGAEALDLYTFGQILQHKDSWSDEQAVYGPVARALQLLGSAERLRGGPGTVRRGTVALLFPQASQVWDPKEEEYCYWRELNGLHAALTHAQYPVDFVDDVDLESGKLGDRDYKALYVSAPNLSAEAQKEILTWVSLGGTLVLLPGACRFDRYDQPTAEMTQAAGAEDSTPLVPRPIEPAHDIDRRLLPKFTITWVDPSFPFQPTTTPFPTRLRGLPGGAKVLAQFTDTVGGAAIVLKTVGNNGGQIISFGYWPGLTYLATIDYDFGVGNRFLPHLPQGWEANERAVATMPATLSGAQKHAELKCQDNGIPVEGIELLVLDTSRGCMVTLLNWVSPVTVSTILTVHPPSNPVTGSHWTATWVRLGIELTDVHVGPTGISVTLPPLETVDVVILKPPDPCQSIIDAVAALQEDIDNLLEALRSGEIPPPPRTPEAIAKVRAFIVQLQDRLARERRLLAQCKGANP